jgi:tetratricopeptide (TPR) repeat protein
VATVWRIKQVCAVALLATAMLAGLAHADAGAIDAARQAFAKGDYHKAIEILRTATASDSNNSELFALLSRSYLQLDQYDGAVSSAEKAVALSPNNSEFHRILGEAYGAKADHSSMFSAYGLARKTQKEFIAATQLDPNNFEAMQNLIEYDCQAPGAVGGGEDKAQPLIQKLMSMDAAEGHYGAGICRSKKKDYATADSEVAKALESKPKTAKRVYDIGDYFLERKNAAELVAVADAGEHLAPEDPRGKFYRGVGLILQGKQPADAEKLLREYIATAPMHSDNPRPWTAHYWLGKLMESQKNRAGARSEYEAALKLEGKYKPAQEALKQLGNN